jgi:hypothetical protein
MHLLNQAMEVSVTAEHCRSGQCFLIDIDSVKGKLSPLMNLDASNGSVVVNRGRVTGALLVTALFGFVAAAFSDAVPLFNTGVDNSGAPLTPGLADSHWSVVAGPGITSPTPAYVNTNLGPDQTQAFFYITSPNSRWVWINADGTDVNGATYTFRTTFDLTGLDLSTVHITGRWGVDNQGFISLNGSSAGIGTGALSLSYEFPSFQQFNPFTLDNGFVPGINTLDFTVVDAGGTGALNVVDLTVIPEPSSFTFVGAAGICLFLGYKNREKKAA